MILHVKYFHIFVYCILSDIWQQYCCYNWLDLPRGKGCEDSRDLLLTITNDNNKHFTTYKTFEILVWHCRFKKKIQASWKKNKNSAVTWLLYQNLPWCTGTKVIRLFRIISIPSQFCYFRPPDQVAWFQWTNRHWTSGVNVHNENSNRFVPF